MSGSGAPAAQPAGEQPSGEHPEAQQELGGALGAIDAMEVEARRQAAELRAVQQAKARNKLGALLAARNRKSTIDAYAPYQRLWKARLLF